MAIFSAVALWHSSSAPPLDQVVVAIVTNGPESGLGKAVLFFAALTSICSFFAGQLFGEGMWWYARDQVIAAAERHEKAVGVPVVDPEVE